MATLPRARRIEEILREAQIDPRLTRVILDLAERQRVQHQQMYEMAKLIVAMQAYMDEVTKKLHIRDGHLEKLGVKEMMTNFQKKEAGALVESVEDFDQQEAAINMDQGRKN